jgi:hypothetical protein
LEIAEILQRTSSVIDRADLLVAKPATGFQHNKNTSSATANTGITVVVCTSRVDLSGCVIGHQIL